MPDVSLNGIEFTIKGSSDAASDSVDKLIGKLNELHASLNKVASVKGFKSAFNGLRSGAEQANKASASFSKLRVALDSIVSVTEKISGALFKGAFKTITYPLRDASKRALGFAKSLGSAFSGLKRIAGYRLIRAAIKAITDGFREGAQHAYYFSKIMNGSLATAFDRLASTSATMKNQLGAGFATLIQAIEPVVQRIIALVNAAAAALTQLISILGGRATWLKATNQVKDYGEAIGGAGGAAKEALKYLAPFDELNVLPDDKGGGGGGGLEDFAGMFEETDYEGFFKQLKTAIDSGDWQSVGTMLGDKVNELVDSVNWDGFGRKIGEKINAWFTTKYWTLKTINFTNIGNNIAQALNGMIDSIDFEIVGRGWTRKFTAFIDTIGGFLGGLNWSNIGKSVGDYLTGALNEATEWLNGIDWDDAGTKLYNAVHDAIAGIDWDALGKAFWEFLKAAIKAAIGGIGGLLDGIFGDFELANIFNPNGGSVLGLPGTNTPTIDVTANVTKVKDKTTEKQKTLNSTANFVEASDDVPEEDKTFKTTSIFTKAKDMLSSVQKTFSSRANFNQSQSSLTTGQRTFASTANFVTHKDNLGNISFGATANINNADTTYINKQRTRINVTAYITEVRNKNGQVTRIDMFNAGGGLYRGGRWNDIARFASGGLARGSQLFWAREAGPELVGTLGGHSAVMNNDQIVASVSAGVARGIAGIHFQLSGVPSAQAESAENEDTLYRAFRRALDETDFGPEEIDLDGSVVYNKMVQRNRLERLRLGINPMLT